MQPARFIDLSNQRIGRWSVSSERRRPPRPSGRLGVMYWLCRCECGLQKWVSGTSLRNGTSRGCRPCSLPDKGLATAMRHGFVPGENRLTVTHWQKVCAGAARRGHPVKITRKIAAELLERQGNRCAITGWPIALPERTRGPKNRGSASLDRIDNDRGYEADNVQWLHWTINKMKGTMKQADFIAACKAVVDVEFILGEKPAPKVSERLLPYGEKPSTVLGSG